MQTTEVYKRGRVISERIDPPLIPSHLDPEYERRTFASICFWMIHDRVPRPGDILRFEELAAVWSEENVNAKVQRIQGAWARRPSIQFSILNAENCRTNPLRALIHTLGPYRRGDVWAWWALAGGTLVVSVLILLRVPFLGVRLGAPAAVTGAGTALGTIVQLIVVGLGLALGAGRLGCSNPPA
jgi:hypothetical protein